MSDPEVCPNCGAKIKAGAFSSNMLVGKAQADLINLYVNNSSSAYCANCFEPLRSETYSLRENEKSILQNKIQEYADEIIISSIHSPEGWIYDVMGMITAQSTLGTGLFSDVASMFTDIVGQESGSYNAKLREGEEHCARRLRMRALEIGGNAILAADIDYAEVGGTRAMLMVCMTGTAVRRPTDEDAQLRFDEAQRALNRLQLISQLEKAATHYSP